MREGVKRRYDNSRRLAQVRATRLKVIEAAKGLFIDHGYPATTLEAVAAAADVALPTLYRLFGSKRALLKAVPDTSLGGDDEPIAFSDRPEQRQARAESDPTAMVRAFAHICRALMERSSEMFHVLSSAAQVDPEIAELHNDCPWGEHFFPLESGPHQIEVFYQYLGGRAGKVSALIEVALDSGRQCLLPATERSSSRSCRKAVRGRSL